MPFAYSFHLQREEDTFRFLFTTASGIPYAVYFIPATEAIRFIDLPSRLSRYGYLMGITRIGDYEDGAFPLDTKIKGTMAEILDLFQQYVPLAVLLINYEGYDGKQHKRYRHFEAWFEELNTRGIWHKENAELVIAGSESIRITAILASRHPDFQAVIKEFQAAANDLIEKM